MCAFQIHSALWFPPTIHADEDGLLGVGGDLSAHRLMLAYRSGIFPWFGPGLPILWFAPDPRFVLWSHDLTVPRSLKKRLKHKPFTITADRAFARVIEACAQSVRPGQDGTWIVPSMISAYQRLHNLGYAHSFEAWSPDGELVGGLYGVHVGGVFCGESMFTRAPDASKAAFVYAVLTLSRMGIDLIDSQVHTDHVARFGALEIARTTYEQALAQRLDAVACTGAWSVPDDDLMTAQIAALPTH